MDCERLSKLIKSWYHQVQDEALAPARMVAFMEKHIFECDVCLLDPKVHQEVEKIADIVFPPSKRLTKKAAEEEVEEEEVQASEDEDEEDGDQDDDY